MRQQQVHRETHLSYIMQRKNVISLPIVSTTVSTTTTKIPDLSFTDRSTTVSMELQVLYIYGYENTGTFLTPSCMITPSPPGVATPIRFYSTIWGEQKKRGYNVRTSEFRSTPQLLFATNSLIKTYKSTPNVCFYSTFMQWKLFNSIYIKLVSKLGILLLAFTPG